MRFKKAYNIMDEYRFRKTIREVEIPVCVGFTSVLTGTGSYAADGTTASVRSGATASSTALAYISTYGLVSSAAQWGPDFTKRTILEFALSPQLGDAATIRYFQMGAYATAGTYGDLAALGIGVKMTGLAMVGESFGTERGEVALGNMVDETYIVVIDHNPAAGRIDWFVNGVLKGSQTTAAKIPNATAAGVSRIVAAVGNGDTEGDARLYFGQIRLLQAV